MKVVVTKVLENKIRMLPVVLIENVQQRKMSKNVQYWEKLKKFVLPERRFSGY